jgi:hypothetical protein
MARNGRLARLRKLPSEASKQVSERSRDEPGSRLLVKSDSSKKSSYLLLLTSHALLLTAIAFDEEVRSKK